MIYFMDLTNLMIIMGVIIFANLERIFGLLECHGCYYKPKIIVLVNILN